MGLKVGLVVIGLTVGADSGRWVKYTDGDVRGKNGQMGC